MNRMNKKRILVAAVVAAVVVAMLATAYISKHKESEEEPALEITHIAAGEDTGVAGLVLDVLPEDIWEENDETSHNGFTTRAQLGEVADSIGVLTIDKIGVSCHVYDSDENTVMEDMKRGAAHYKSTSYWDGNVAFSAHIGNLAYCYFNRLYELKEGDIITYETTLGLRQYAVVSSTVISEEDWSLLERTEDNRVTLTTCIEGKPEQRLCVQAVEITA